MTAHDDATRALGIAESVNWAAARKKIARRATRRERATAVNVLGNIESEEMICGEGDSPDRDLFAAVLRALSRKGWPASDPKFVTEYETRVAQHALSGKRLLVPPKVVYRFISAPSLFSWIVEALKANEGTAGMAQTLRKMLDDARSPGVPRVEWQQLAEYVMRPECWGVLKDRIKMTRKAAQFVTFESEPGELDGDASEIFLRLGPEPHEAMTRAYVVVRYATEAADELRFPTFTDAGWRGQFSGARTGQAHGWTRPRDPTMKGVPEACQPAQTFARVVPVSSDFCIRD